MTSLSSVTATATPSRWVYPQEQQRRRQRRQCYHCFAFREADSGSASDSTPSRRDQQQQLCCHCFAFRDADSNTIHGGPAAAAVHPPSNCLAAGLPVNNVPACSSLSPLSHGLTLDDGVVVMYT